MHSFFQATSDVAPTFFSMKNEYKKSRKGPEVRMQDYDRWEEVLLLAPRTDRDGTKAHRKLNVPKNTILRNYAEGPLNIRKRYDQYPQTSDWLVLCTNISLFCLLAGGSHSVSDPLENISELRRQISVKEARNMIPLLNEISVLKEEKREQESVIIALTFRHMIEQMSADCTGASATLRWADLWKRSWGNAMKLGSPLSKLWNENSYIKDQAPIKDLGARMFSTLSGDIHKFYKKQKIDAS